MHFNAQFYTTHPTFFVFLEVLVKLQTYVKMRGTNVDSPFKETEREINELTMRQSKNTHPVKLLVQFTCSKSYFHLPVGELGGGGQHIVIFYFAILVYGERKGSLPGHKLVKPGHYLENSYICIIFQSALLTVWFAAHFILCHGMISAQT